MPYPSPILTELNLLFENRSPRKLNASSLQKSVTGAPRHGSESPASSSPASSTSTLVEDEFTSVKFLWEDQPTPATPREELNPLAAPFVPTSRAQPVAKAPVPRVVPKPTAQPQLVLPVWFDAFSRGVCASAAPDHRTYAIAIVSSRRWPIEAMAELAQHFCWRGAEKLTEESAGIAPFAFMVYRQFFAIHGEETAQSFIWHLRECVIGAFKACWDPDSPNAITYLNAPSFNYVASAIAQATFIGQLFTHDLIPGPHTATCIITLLKGLNSYEHLEAVYAIVSKAGPSFWHGPGTPGQGNIAIHRFVATFLDTVAPMTGNMSVLGRPLKAGDMQGLIMDIEAMVCGWEYDPVRASFKGDNAWPKLSSSRAV
ncbi:hypothetical protein B0H17DRAFT_1183402 [Mycena rosella]|uniref:Uncharacterized protein n=1 Tax=Mycena rosella TaxID=1033263 RepID=A0AAD7D0Q1_MYCRO|nr:hypothetical protein B0H17DRAFT_1183402 [Mycena rosella]